MPSSTRRRRRSPHALCRAPPASQGAHLVENVVGGSGLLGGRSAKRRDAIATPTCGTNGAPRGALRPTRRRPNDERVAHEASLCSLGVELRFGDGSEVGDELRRAPFLEELVRGHLRSARQTHRADHDGQ